MREGKKKRKRRKEEGEKREEEEEDQEESERSEVRGGWKREEWRGAEGVGSPGEKILMRET